MLQHENSTKPLGLSSHSVAHCMTATLHRTAQLLPCPSPLMPTHLVCRILHDGLRGVHNLAHRLRQVGVAVDLVRHNAAVDRLRCLVAHLQECGRAGNRTPGSQPVPGVQALFDAPIALTCSQLDLRRPTSHSSADRMFTIWAKMMLVVSQAMSR